MHFRKENVILNTKFLLLLLHSVQCIVQFEDSSVDESRFIVDYSHTNCNLKACFNNIESH